MPEGDPIPPKPNARRERLMVEAAQKLRELADILEALGKDA